MIPRRKGVRLIILFVIALLSAASDANGLPNSPDVSAAQQVSYSREKGTARNPAVSVVQLIKRSRERMAAGDLDAALSLAHNAAAIDPAYADAWKQQGRVLMLRGEFTEALASLETAFDIKADDVEVQGWILILLLDLGLPDKMVQRFESLKDSDIAKLNSTLVTDLVRRLLKKSQHSQAAKIAARLEKLVPQPSARSAPTAIVHLINSNLVMQSKERVAAGDLDAALSLAHAAAAKDPTYIDAWKQQGRVLMLRGEFTEALISLETALKLKSGDVEVQGWILILLLDLGLPDKMVQRFESLKDSDIAKLNNPWMTDLLARLLEKSWYSQAGKIASHWEKLAAQPGARSASAAIHQLISGDMDASENTLKTADISLQGTRPLIALALQRLGIKHLENNEPLKAIPPLQRALELRPDWLAALRELGWAYRAAGRPAQAADAWNHGFQKDSRLVDWLGWITEARVEAGQLKEATTTIESLLKLEPANDRGRALKLMVLLLQDNAKEAQHYEQQLKTVSGGDHIISFGHVLADRHAGRFPDAARHLEDLFHSNPDDPEIRALLADTYAGWAAHVNIHEALYPLQKLVAMEPKRAGAWRDLGWSLWVRDQHDEAISAWDHAFSSEVPNRDRLIVQVIARLAEDGHGTKAIELYKRWNPAASFFSLGLELFRLNRFLAAKPMLAEAWKSGENLLTTGLYLASVEARTSSCSLIPEHISPFMERGITNAPQAEIDIVLDMVYACSYDQNLLALINKLDTSIGSIPAYTLRITDILEKAAKERREIRDLESSFSLYKRLSERDPNRISVWSHAAEVAEELERHQEAITLLNNIIARTSSVAVREGIKGKLADDQGNSSLAIASYRRSLADYPNQADLRFALFKDLISLRHFEEARAESDWFGERVAEGDTTVKSHLAETLSALGRTTEALKIWQELHLTYPETFYYALETARTLYQSCHAEEAIPLLEQLVIQTPHPRGFELLAEIDGAAGRPEGALKWTAAGLALQSTPKLLQYRAEAAEALDEAQIAREAAEALLKIDPDNVSMALIAGRTMLAQGRIEEAKQHYEGLLKRNPSFLPSLVHLREIATQGQRLDHAIHFSKQRVQQRPWDIDAQLHYAISLAEAEKFKPALKSLRSLAAQPIHHAVPVLIYRNVTQCPYPGNNTTKQVMDHLEQLSNAHYHFITPSELDGARKQNKLHVLVIIDNAELPALIELDKVLQRLRGRATYACDTDALIKNVPNHPIPSFLSELQRSGRWEIASKGPTYDRHLMIQDGTAQGNPLTHRLITKKGKEDDVTMVARLNQLLGKVAEPLRIASSRSLIYPGGDYGHLSLDTDFLALEILRNTTKQNFAFAFTYGADEAGFLSPEFDPLRLSGRVIPASWNAGRLLTHLRQNNPFVRARLELAKAFYWQGQHERANLWFRIAEAAGADMKEVNLHWGGNAHLEGDLPTALRKLRQAHALDPTSPRINSALERTESRKPPVLDLHIGAWKDSDDRRYSMGGGSVQGYIFDGRLQLELSPDRDKWSRKRLGNEKSTRWGGRLQWHFAEEHWVNAKMWQMKFDDVKDHIGGLVNLHLPNAPFGGYVELEAAREEMDTVESVRAKILENRYALFTYSRIYDMWDLFADFSFTHRNDNNDTIMGEGRFVRRLREWPFWGIGYSFRFADSDRKPPEYWAPEGLQLHQGYVTTRGEYSRLHYVFSGQAGYADDDNKSWRFVWGIRAELDFRITSKLFINGKYIHQETPTYDRDNWLFSVKYRF